MNTEYHAITQCCCVVSLCYAACCQLTKHGVQFAAEVAVHERIDERVSDVVEEVDVED